MTDEEREYRLNALAQAIRKFERDYDSHLLGVIVRRSTLVKMSLMARGQETPTTFAGVNVWGLHNENFTHYLEEDEVAPHTSIGGWTDSPKVKIWPPPPPPDPPLDFRRDERLYAYDEEVGF